MRVVPETLAPETCLTSLRVGLASQGWELRASSVGSWASISARGNGMGCTAPWFNLHGPGLQYFLVQGRCCFCWPPCWAGLRWKGSPEGLCLPLPSRAGGQGAVTSLLFLWVPCSLTCVMWRPGLFAPFAVTVGHLSQGSAIPVVSGEFSVCSERTSILDVIHTDPRRGCCEISARPWWKSPC